MEDQIWEASSYLVAIMGSIFLWINYALFGLIARRYGQVFNKITYSTLLIMAPTGILVYTLFLIFKATPLLSDPKLAELAQWTAYLALVASGFLCLVGIARFASVFANVTRAQPQSGGAGEEKS
ncbi:hypothetical protein K8S19_09960 [bacterium]|nr:hypothetical protein [bacterium]